MTSAISNTYARLPVAFTHGKGVWLWDTNGRRYLDAMAGIGVSCLGHGHPKLVEAISQQAAFTAQVAAQPTVRPDQVDRAKQLLSSPNYPPRAILEAVAKLISDSQAE